MHVFRFSPRPGTPAATMEGQVPAEVARERSERLRALGDELRAADAHRRVGTVEAVLVERVEKDGSAFGTSASYHEVAFVAGPGAPAASGLVRARFDAVDEHGRLVGFLLDPQVES
jgi:threonylcarbamoyladenosine tRNA methylthiotransferase MtaB